MWKFFEKTKGAISVFLTLILLPTLLLGGLTTDAARIYASKVVISDAGEMAMNAALAQYDEELLDKYGLFVMSETPESMQTDLEDFFVKSLNAKGIPGEEDYDKILQLTEEKFEVINLEASKIYQTEVEKQQIIEYMKYRAPVCLAEELLGKLEELKEQKKAVEAMKAQIEFAEDMEECQDSMEEAKEALDHLNEHLQNYLQLNVQGALDRAQRDYQNEMSKAFLMIAAISHYQEKDTNQEGDVGAQSYITAAGKVDLENPLTEESFENYLSCLYYQESARKLAGKISEHAETEPENKESEEYTEWKTEKDRLDQLQTDYESAALKVNGYLGKLREIAKNFIDTVYGELHAIYTDSQTGQSLANTAAKKLEKVKKKIDQAEKSWENWAEKANLLNGETGAGMQESVSEYEKFFDSEDGRDKLGKLMEKVVKDEASFKAMKELLEKEKFFGQKIAVVSPDRQYSDYMNKANEVAFSAASYLEIESLRENYKANYEHMRITSEDQFYGIETDEFYQKLCEYCDTQESEEGKEKKKEVNGKLNEGSEAAGQAKNDNGYPEYQWGLDDTMPSVKLQKEKERPEEGSELGGDVNGKSGRKNAIKEYKKAIEDAGTFLTKLDRILTEGLGNLYVAEYALQMFSYYTIDKKNGEEIPEDEILSLSGYKLKENEAYRAEVEYILWGDADSKVNVRNTVMTIFGIRLLLNSVFAFTNRTIARDAWTMANAIAGAAPYLVPVLQVIIQFAYAAAETGNDVGKIKDGYGVTMIKKESNWVIQTPGLLKLPGTPDNTKGVTLNYREFLRIFLNINMLGGLEANKLARIGDCIQNNTEFNMINGYTMLAVEAKVKIRTTFMKKFSDLGSGSWNSPDGGYSILYQSVLGY